MKTDLTAGLIGVLKAEYGLMEPVLDIPGDGIEGSTFIVTDGKQKYAAKLYHDNLRAETVSKFQDCLFAAQLSVPAVLPTKAGRLTVRLQDHTVVLSEFVSGRPIGWGKEFATLSGPLTVDLASAVANMHIISQAMSTEPKLDHSLSVAQLLDRSDSDSKLELSASRLARVRKAMIHGDLARENIFLAESDSSIKSIIDFGDAHYDYITYDVATLLTQVYVTKSWGVDFQGIEEFLTLYRRLNQLQHDELQTILPLMELRNRGLLQEIEQRLNEGNTDIETLESIRQSLRAKLRLMEEHSQQLEDLILED